MMDSTLTAELNNEAQRIEEDAIFSAKGHYNAVAPWRWGHRILGLVSAAGSTLAALSVLKQWNPAIAVTAAAVSTLAAVVFTTLRPNEEADRHQRAADRYLAIRNQARIFRRIQLISSSASDGKLIEEIKALSQGLADVRSGAPTIPKFAYLKAKREIEIEKTAEYQVDKGHRR